MYNILMMVYNSFGDEMNWNELIILPIIAMVVLFLLTKFMGYRQITQLSLYDYIIGITIGSIASEVAVSTFDDFLKPLIAMIVFGLGTYVLSFITRISKKMRSIIEGKPLILYENNQIYFDALKMAKIDLDEFLMTCRVNQFFNLSDLDKIILETNGRFSFYPKESSRQLQYHDLDKQLNKETMPITLIKEGQIIKDNLKMIQHDVSWLHQQLDVKGLKLDDIEYLYVDSKGNLDYYVSNKKKSYFI